jgi:hypothetical protein
MNFKTIGVVPPQHQIMAGPFPKRSLVWLFTNEALRSLKPASAQQYREHLFYGTSQK